MGTKTMLVMLAAIMMWVLAACGGGGGNAAETGAGAASDKPAEASKDSILIGVSTEATGDNAMNSVNLY
ncbi:hypothetical protein NL317_31645, partial [Klebsiella pneumoniae]|nr:hypothetical protein [Klebsiella pneumoniae]